MLIDEILLIGLDTFNRLNKALRVIKQNTLPFVISLQVIVDFLQLTPMKQLHIFAEGKKGTYEAFSGSLWVKLFKLFELNQIVRQSGDPAFAQLLNCSREEKHTLDDIEQIQSLANADTSDWPKDCLELYLTNILLIMKGGIA